MTQNNSLDLENLRNIRKNVIIAIFADDYLMNKFVLKGGSAIDLIYKINSRSSLDIDTSIENDFTPEELAEVTSRLNKSLESVFSEQGYYLFDFKLYPRPRTLGADRPMFWGGYNVEFKLIPGKKAKELKYDVNEIRKNSEILGPNNIKRFIIEISKCEYCGEKIAENLEGYTIYVYSPKMIIIEKLRAICQQMTEYPLSNTQRPRPRDFYDIYTIATQLGIDITSEDLPLIRKVFDLKEVPLELLSFIKKYEQFHRNDEESLMATIPDLKGYDFGIYFDYVVDLASSIYEYDQMSQSEAG